MSLLCNAGDSSASLGQQVAAMGNHTVGPEGQRKLTFVEMPRGPRTAMPYQRPLEKVLSFSLSQTPSERPGSSGQGPSSGELTIPSRELSIMPPLKHHLEVPIFQNLDTPESGTAEPNTPECRPWHLLGFLLLIPNRKGGHF